MCSRLAVAAALAGPAGARSRRPPSRRFALLAGALLLTAGALRATEIPWSDAFALYDEYPGVFTVAAADIDRDGISDLVAAAPETNALAWFRHLGNGVFVAKVIAFPVASIHDAQVADLDRDGDPDIVVTSGDDSDAVGWFENDGTPLDGGWTLHYIATGFDEGGRLAIADFDRDGDLDVAAASAIEEGGTVAVALNADGLGTSWTFEIVDAAFDAALRALAGDIDGDGDADLAGVAFGDDGIGGFAWWSRGAGVWARHVVAWPVPAARALALCDVDRDGDLDLIGSACATAIDEVLWWENPTWAIHGVASDLGAWNLEAADLDRDGDCDLLYGALADDWAGWVENADGAGGSWTPRPMPEVVDHVFGITADDFDRDGDLDFVAAAGGPDDLLAWGNLTLHRNARFPVEKSTGLGGATRALAAGDLDGDGDPDLLGGALDFPDLVWWENLGAAADWAKHSISTDFSARAVAIADVDGGGLADAVAVGPGGVHHWYHVPGGGWTEYEIPSSLGSPVALATGDLDRDGDLDLVCAEQVGGLIWLANNRDATDFTEHAIGAPFLAGGDALALADFDRDGDLDVVVGMLAGLGWYANELAGGGDFAAAASIAAGLDQPRALAVGDIDHDGDADVAAVETGAGTLSWWANLTGDGASWSAAQPVAAGLDGPRELLLADLDLDGDLDLALGAENSTTHASLVAWYESSAFGASWTAHVISEAPQRPTALAAADFDGDGDADLAVGSGALEPRWFQNRGGQAALPTAPTGPHHLPPGVCDDLLAIDVEHRGRTGDGNARALALGLRFTDEALVPLTTAQANALVERLSFYGDDGDGFFQLAEDLLLRHVETLALTDGAEVYPLVDSTWLEVAPGESHRLFVAVELTADAPAQVPDRFRLVHRAAASLVEDRGHGIPLALEDPREVAALLVAVPALVFADGFESGDCGAWDYAP